MDTIDIAYKELLAEDKEIKKNNLEEIGFACKYEIMIRKALQMGLSSKEIIELLLKKLRKQQSVHEAAALDIGVEICKKTERHIENNVNFFKAFLDLEKAKDKIDSAKKRLSEFDKIFFNE
ncbi:MAG: hypothetical protein ACFFG0_04240 [Candidatus Thorarchaeota archaeon]